MRYAFIHKSYPSEKKMKRTSSPLQKEVHTSNQPATALQLQSFRARGIPRYNVQPVLFAPRGPARREGDVRVAA